jgi:D-sedoheptulose 7-phosphate isomerase
VKSDWLGSVTEHVTLVAGLSAVLAAQWDPAVTLLTTALFEGHKILLCGNGGSACDASHLAAELVGRFYLDRKAYPAIALSADSAILTALANDYDFAQVFARQVKAYGEAGDVLIALSTSGRSKNVLEAILAAKFLGMGTLGISGRTQLNCDVDIAIPSNNTARIQELTLLTGHIIIEGLEQRLPT